MGVRHVTVLILLTLSGLSRGAEDASQGLRALLPKLLRTDENELLLGDPEGNPAFVGFSTAGAQARLLTEAAKHEEANPERAADLYLEVLGVKGDEVYPISRRLYVNSKQYALDRIIALSGRLSDSYRLRQNREAERLRAEKGDGCEREILARCPASYLAARALYDLACRELDRGNTLKASGYLRKLALLDDCGGLDPSLVAAKASLALVLGGKRSEALDALLKIDPLVPTSRGRVPLSKLCGLVSVTVAKPSPGWTSLGGNSTHNAYIPKPAAALRERWSFGIQRSLQGYPDMPPTTLALDFPYVVLAGSKVVFSTGAQLFFLDRRTGVQPWIINTESRGYGSSWFGFPVTDGERLYWLQGSGASGEYPGRTIGELYAKSFRSLREQGCEWKLEGAIGLPAVEQGRLFALAVDPLRSTEVYLDALEPRSGTILWRTFLCTRTAESYSAPAACGIVAVSQGRVFAATGNGVLAAVDADCGELHWTTLYDRSVDRVGAPYYPIVFPRSTLLADGATVVVSPGDSSYIYGVEAESGNILYRIEKGTSGHLVAVQGSRLYTSGTTLTCYDVSSQPRKLWEVPVQQAQGVANLCGGNLYQPTASGMLIVDAATGLVTMLLPWKDFAQGVSATPQAPADTEEGDSRPPIDPASIRPAFVTVDGDDVVLAGYLGIAVYERLGDVEDIAARRGKDLPTAALYYRLGTAYEEAGKVTEALDAYLKAAGLVANGDRLGSAVAERVYCCFRKLAEKSSGDERLAYLEKALQSASSDSSKVECSLLLGGEVRDPRRSVELYQFVIERGPPDAVADATAGIKSLLAKHGRAIYAEYEARAEALAAVGSKDACDRLERLYPNSLALGKLLFRLAKDSAQKGQTARAAAYLIKLLRGSSEPGARIEALRDMLAASVKRGMIPLAVSASRELERLGEKTSLDLPALLRSRRTVPRGWPGTFAQAKPVTLQPGIRAGEFRDRVGVALDMWRLSGQPYPFERGRLLLVAGWSLFAYDSTGRQRWASSPAWMGIGLRDLNPPHGALVDRVYADTPAARAGMRENDIIVRFDGIEVKDTQHLIRLCAASEPRRRVEIVVLRKDEREIAPKELTTICELGARPVDVDAGSASLLGAWEGVIALEGSGFIVGVDSASGRKAWSLSLDVESQRNALMPGQRDASADYGLVAFRTSPGEIGLMDGATGEVLWRQKVTKPFRDPPIVTPAGILLATSDTRTLLLFDALTGELRASLAGLAAAAGEDFLYVATNDEVQALDYATLRPKWHADFAQAKSLSTGRDFVAVVRPNAYALFRQTGELLARGDLEQPDRVEVLDANGPRIVSYFGNKVRVELPGGWKHQSDVVAGQVKAWGDCVVCAGVSEDGNILVQVLDANGDVEKAVTFWRVNLAPVERAAGPAGGNPKPGPNVLNRGVRMLPNGRIVRVGDFGEGAFRFALIVAEDGIFIVTEANLAKISAEKE